MLQRSAAWIECEVNVIVQETAEGSHVDVRETTQSSGEIRWVVTSSEDAAEMRVEEVLHHHPATDQPGQFELYMLVKIKIQMMHYCTQFHKLNAP